MTERTIVRSYETDFAVDENPVSENGMWLNGKTDAIDFTDCITSNGIMHGAPSRMNVLEKRAEQGNLEGEDEAPAGDYDDPTAILSGEWGPNQHAWATAHVSNPTEDWFQEVQIRLRNTGNMADSVTAIFNTPNPELAIHELDLELNLPKGP